MALEGSQRGATLVVTSWGRFHQLLAKDEGPAAGAAVRRVPREGLAAEAQAWHGRRHSVPRAETLGSLRGWRPPARLPERLEVEFFGNFTFKFRA